MRLSVTPSTKCSCSGSPPILANGRTTIERRGGADFSGAEVGASLPWTRRADFKQIDPDRFGDVLELGRTEIGDGKIEPPLHLTVGVLGQADRARLGDAFQTRGDIDAVAHQIAVGLLDDIAQMNADAEVDASLGRQTGVARNHAVLNLDRASHRVDHAAKFDDDPVASPFDDAAVARVDCWVDEVAAQRPQPRQRSSSSAPASRLYPTTSATRIAAIFRVSLMARPHAIHLSIRRIGSADLAVEMLVWVGVSARQIN